MAEFSENEEFEFKLYDETALIPLKIERFLSKKILMGGIQLGKTYIAKFQELKTNGRLETRTFHACAYMFFKEI